jgi:hypothetical protein
MGASVSAYWPGISEDQIESQPGFFNDCKAWGNWMANREEHTDVIEAMKRLNVDALCTYKTDGVEDADVAWATPSELERAALRLRELVLAGHPDTKRILEVYSQSANAVDSISEEFAHDLADVAELARFAIQAGASRMTLEVNW